ncbi:DUF3850 domain-containing protein [Arundinibacter roseus]|uniref:DUF3850 domain-containing protein n=2 Tax=Arundinibacter roseus TaxID=2070510 RepID=A0A4R4K9Y6_9BACT|nr:DUF3850 domain-containing protein [Arundinibacter roseus]
MLVDVLLPWIDEGNSGKLRGPIKRHALKTDKGYFDRVWAGQKNFELRKNDRAFQVGDTLLLREYDPENSSYSGREILAGVDFIFSSLPGLQDGYCIMKIFIEKQYKVTPVEIEGRLTN